MLRSLAKSPLTSARGNKMLTVRKTMIMRVQQQNRPMHDPRPPYQRVKLDITKSLRGVPWSTDHHGVHDASGSNPGADYKQQYLSVLL